jgi:hypothetical protein
METPGDRGQGPTTATRKEDGIEVKALDVSRQRHATTKKGELPGPALAASEPPKMKGGRKPKGTNIGGCGINRQPRPDPGEPLPAPNRKRKETTHVTVHRLKANVHREKPATFQGQVLSVRPFAW